MKPWTMVAATIVAGVAFGAHAQQGDGTDVAISTHVFKPAKVAATDARIAALKAPRGFEVSVYARELGNARILAVAPNGDVYVSRREEGDVLLLKDGDGDGRADGAPVTVLRRAGAHGIAVHDGKLWLVTVKELFVADIRPDGTLGTPKLLLGDLPDSGQHPNRTLAFGPDGMIYLSVGSTCNACNESNPENATLLRVMPDGQSRTIFASGLRNTIGYDWHPATGELWGFDHGIDFLGDEIQPEELNRIEQGKQYGWPHVWGAGDENPQSTPPGKLTKAQWRAISEPMVLGYDAHAAPMQFVFTRGANFPASYDGDAFATMRGSWNTDPAAGYEIVHVDFEDGRPTSITPFVTGFLTDGGKTHIARPVGLAFAKDGALLMADDANGVIYRIAYTGKDARQRAADAREAPADAMKRQAMKGVGVPLALARVEAEGKPLALRAATFADGAPMPPLHSNYHDDVSPRLEWPAVAGARAYVLIVEDPDAKPITPYVHWVAWNIPGELSALPEGLPKQLRLTAPYGVMQGPNSKGTAGWIGPRPPVGDPPHHYHFQLFALDAVLDLAPGADRDAVLAAMKGHVLAKGETVGTYRQAQAPLK